MKSDNCKAGAHNMCAGDFLYTKTGAEILYDDCDCRCHWSLVKKLWMWLRSQNT